MDTKEYLEITTMSILEESAFLFSEPLESSPEIKPTKMMGCKMTFDNDQVGIITLFCEKEIAILLAANMLGCEEDDQIAIDSAESAFKEFTNILSGNILTKIYGTEVVINLSLPKLIDISELQLSEEIGDCAWFDVDGYKMVVMISVE